MISARRYHLHKYLTRSLWVGPFLGLAAAPIVALCTRQIDLATNWTLLGFSPEGARGLVGILCAAILSFIVFLFSTLLIVVQLASTELTPRLISMIIGRGPGKFAAGVFVFSFVYCAAVMGRITSRVPQLQILVVLILATICIAMFLFVVDYTAKMVRPASMLASVGEEGRRVIDSVYPLEFVQGGGGPPNKEQGISISGDTRTIVHTGSSGVVLAVNFPGLLSLAERHDCGIVLVPQVGDFVPTGTALFEVIEKVDRTSARELRGLIAFGAERTMDEDPAFAFRIIVDVASKALSPGINDPTTAVLAIDQLHRLLRRVGSRQLDTGRLYDGAGQLRVVYRTPDWEDFVALAVTEVRLFGANSIQICRRLSVMLVDLIKLLPPQRGPALQAQLELLHRSIDREFAEPEDRRRAMTGDYQGMGSGS